VVMSHCCCVQVGVLVVKREDTLRSPRGSHRAPKVRAAACLGRIGVSEVTSFGGEPVSRQTGFKVGHIPDMFWPVGVGMEVVVRVRGGPGARGRQATRR
jgi:hypothetical protein